MAEKETERQSEVIEKRARVKVSEPVIKPGTTAPQPASTDSGESKTK